jgi:hypothetical protein
MNMIKLNAYETSRPVWINPAYLVSFRPHEVAPGGCGRDATRVSLSTGEAFVVSEVPEVVNRMIAAANGRGGHAYAEAA